MAKKKTITSNTSGTILTTSNATNVSHSIYTAMGTTSTTWYHNPNIGNVGIGLTKPTPFHINFSWDGKTVDVTLKDGNDVFKLANAFMKWLDTNEIEYSVKTKGRKKIK